MTRSRVYYSWKNTDSGHGGVYKREQKVSHSADVQERNTWTDRGSSRFGVRARSRGRAPGSLPTWHMSPECPDVDICTEHTTTNASWAPGLGAHSDCHRHPGPGRAKEAPASPPTADHTRGVRVRASLSTQGRKARHQRLHQSVHCKGSSSTAQGWGNGGLGWGCRHTRHGSEQDGTAPGRPGGPLHARAAAALGRPDRSAPHPRIPASVWRNA